MTDGVEMDRAAARPARRGTLAWAAIATTILLGACERGATTATEAPLPATHRVQIAVAGDGIGTVRLTPAGLDCAAGTQPCATSIAEGTVAGLTATAEPGSRFVGWTGADCASAPTCAFRVDGARTITAAFARARTHALTVVTAGPGAGSVTSSPAGVSCVRGAEAQSGACELPLGAATSVTLTATPAAGHVFTGWSGAGAACAGTAPCTLTVSEAHSVVATFAPAAVELTLEIVGAGAGAVTSTPAGVTCRRAPDGATTGTCVAPFAPGTSVTLTASPAPGSTFAGWSGGGSAACTTAPTCTFPVAGADTVRATFAPAPVTLTVVLAGSGRGAVAGGGVACATGADAATGPCDVDVAPGTTVTLRATPAEGSTFAGWTGGGCSGTGACTTTVRQATTVTATFEAVRPTLHVETAGAGAGSVTGTPGGLACTHTGGVPSGSCTASYPAGTAVTLTASAATGSVFAGWSGAGCTGTAPCVVTVEGARQVTATFVPTFALAVGTLGTGAGRVVSSPAGIDCARAAGTQRGSCAGTYAGGTTVTLVATPATGATFTGWSGGGCSGTGPCVVRMTAAQTVTANFWLPLVSLTVGTAGTGSGTVTATPAGIACTRSAGTQSGSCSESYIAGSTVTLTATPASGSGFAGWSGGGCSGTGPCTVALDVARTVSATFGPEQVLLTVTLPGNGAGTVTSSPAGVTCTRAPDGTMQGRCSVPFDRGSVVTLTVATTTYSGFSIWSDDRGYLSSTRTISVTMSAPQNVSAALYGDFSPPVLSLSGVTDGGAYATHPTIRLSYADDVGFDQEALRLSWRVQTSGGATLCFAGMSGVTPTFTAATGPTCPTLVAAGTGQLTASGLSGEFDLTVHVVDNAGHASTPKRVRYTVGS